MLKTILSVSGKPGLYKLLSQGKNMLIVESLKDKKRLPVYINDKVVSLGDIAMYTVDAEVPLRDVMQKIYEKENGPVAIDVKKASNDELKEFFAQILPDYDRERVYVTDIKKLINWYNLLVNNGYVDFKEEISQEEKPEE